MRAILPIFILLFGPMAYNQTTDLRNKIVDLVTQIAAQNEYNSEAVGAGGERTKQWDRFQQLKRKAALKK